MNNKRTSAWILILAVSALALATPAGLIGAALVAFTLAAALTPATGANRGFARAASIDAELNVNEILDSALTAFKRHILPLTMFSTVFRNVQLKGSNKVAVPYYPLETSASRDFDAQDGYVFDDTSTVDSREVTVNKRKYQPIALTSEEIARYPILNAQRLGEVKGQKLASDVITDILSLVTAANFGSAVFTGAANTFDSDDVADIRAACGTANWPDLGRGLALNPTYDASLMKDGDVKPAYAIGDNGVIVDGRLPRLLGFDYATSPSIPANGENLVGFAAYMSAILAAFSPIEPAPAVRENLVDYQVVTDPDTGISIEYRVWGDPDSDTEKRIIECNYGYALGEAAALKRIVSA